MSVPRRPAWRRVVTLLLTGFALGVAVAAADREVARFPTGELGFALMAGFGAWACMVGHRAAWEALPPRGDTRATDWADPRLPWLVIWVGLGGQAGTGRFPSRHLPRNALSLRVLLVPPLVAQLLGAITLWLAWRAAMAAWMWWAA